MKPERDSSERATRPISEISISVEPDSLELSEELLRMDAAERRRLELKALALMQAQIETMLFSAPVVALSSEPLEPPVLLFYRPKA